MSASATSNRVRGGSWWARVLRLLGVATGLVAAAPFSLARAQNADFRPAAAAPAAWQGFALELLSRFQQRLGSDDEAAQRLQEALATREKRSAQTLVVRTWIAPSGMIERLEFDGIDEADVAVNLRALLTSVVLSRPPADMLQPLHLRLSPRTGEPPRRDQ